MPVNVYVQDSGVAFTGSFTRQDNGMPFDPSGGVIARVKRPDGTEMTYDAGIAPEFVNPSTGIYVLTILLTQPGLWGVHMIGAGAAPNPAVGAVAMDDRVVARPAAA